MNLNSSARSTHAGRVNSNLGLLDAPRLPGRHEALNLLPEDGSWYVVGIEARRRAGPVSVECAQDVIVRNDNRRRLEVPDGIRLRGRQHLAQVQTTGTIQESGDGTRA